MASSDKNKLAAMNRIPFRRYHGISGVVITSVTGTKVGFSAPRVPGTGGTPDLEAEWGDESVMWPYFPSTLTSQAASQPEDPGTDHGPGDPGPPPALLAGGMLYLEGTFCAQKGIAPPPGTNRVTPKWPDRLADPLPSGTLQVQLKVLTLEGILLGKGTPLDRSLDLLDRALVPEQTIEIGDGAVQVRLTERGFQALQVPVKSTGVVVFAANHVNLTGIELENGLQREGTVDLMNLALAPRRQLISLDGDPIQVRLTRDGFKVFKVVFSPTP